MAKGPFYEQSTYMCEITSQDIGEARTGTPQIIFGFKVLGYAGDAGEIEEVGQQQNRTTYLAVSPARMPYLAEELAGMGYMRPDLSPLAPEHPSHVSLIGKTIRCECTHQWDEKAGLLRERWQPARGRAKPRPVEAGKMRNLDLLYGQTLTAQNSPPQAPVNSMTKPVIDDSDIPF